MRARNLFGFSDYSSTISILAAKTPEKPLAPVTYIDGLNVIIDWAAPFDNGSPILGYKVLVR